MYIFTSTTTQLIQHQQLQVALQLTRMTVCKVTWGLMPEASSTVCMSQSCTYTSIILQKLLASTAEALIMDMAPGSLLVPLLHIHLLIITMGVAGMDQGMASDTGTVSMKMGTGSHNMGLSTRVLSLTQSFSQTGLASIQALTDIPSMMAGIPLSEVQSTGMDHLPISGSVVTTMAMAPTTAMDHHTTTVDPPMEGPPMVGPLIITADLLTTMRDPFSAMVDPHMAMMDPLITPADPPTTLRDPHAAMKDLLTAQRDPHTAMTAPLNTMMDHLITLVDPHPTMRKPITAMTGPLSTMGCSLSIRADLSTMTDPMSTMMDLLTSIVDPLITMTGPFRRIEDQRMAKPPLPSPMLSDLEGNKRSKSWSNVISYVLSRWSSNIGLCIKFVGVML